MVAQERINICETVGRKNNCKLNFFSMYFVQSQVKVSLDGKFSEINLQLKNIKERFTSTVNYIVTESILKVKDSVIEALKVENIKLQKSVKTLKLDYLIWKKLQINTTSTLGGITLKYMAYQ